MNADVGTERCEDCGHHVASHDTIKLSISSERTRRVCTRCFNARIACSARHGLAAELLSEISSGAFMLVSGARLVGRLIAGITLVDDVLLGT